MLKEVVVKMAKVSLDLLLSPKFRENLFKSFFHASNSARF